MSARRTAWRESNRIRLFAEIDRVRETIAAPAAAPAHRAERRFRIDQLSDRFTLSSFERDVVLLAAGMELDKRMADVIVAADPTAAGPTAALALAQLPQSHWDAFRPEGALRGWSLLIWPRDDQLMQTPFAIDPPLLDWLSGISDVCTALARESSPIPAGGALPEAWRALADRIAVRLRSGSSSAAIVLVGADRAGRISLARAAAAEVGLNAWLVDPDSIPRDAAARRGYIRLWERELLLSSVIPIIDLGDSATPAAIAFVDAFSGPLFVSGQIGETTRGTWAQELPAVEHVDRVALWSRALDVDADVPALERLAYQFALSPSDIAHAAVEASSVATAGERIDRAWSEARTRTRRDAGDTVRRIVSTVTLDDLVLPAAQRRSIDAIADQVRHQATVYGTWGMAGASRRGLGITALFSGPSGSGKTTAAEALAGALGLDLLHVDLSQVVSKYIGETSKNLDQVFACAEAGGAVLLFDEADAIFGKRSEVKDSHDRYANMEVSFLLQRMETYRGLAILTTNQKGGMDDAFLRRIRFVVNFPFPDRAMRTELWRRAMPVELMSTEPDWNELSRLSVAGGSIRNIALNAAFLAAAEGTRITPQHIARAIGAESAKTESAPMQLLLARSAS